MNPYYSDRWVTIYLGDCREILPQLEVKVDLVLTDPPYGISYQSAATKRYEIIMGDKEFDLSNYWGMIEDKINNNGAIYLFCRYDIAHRWWDIVNPTNQIVVPRGKVNMGDLDDFSTEYEILLFKQYGTHKIDATELKIPNNSHIKNPPPYKERIGNLWLDVVSNEAWERASHPTQKSEGCVSNFKLFPSFDSAVCNLIEIVHLFENSKST